MKPTVRLLALNFALGMNGDYFSIVPSKYQGINDTEIDSLRGAVIQRYSSDFTYRFVVACLGSH